MAIRWRKYIALVPLLMGLACGDSPDAPVALETERSRPRAEVAETAPGPPTVVAPAFVVGMDGPPGGPLLYRPSSVAIDSDNQVYVLDSGNHRVVKLSGAGKQVHEFGRAGRGPGELASASRSNQLVVEDGRIVVLDRTSTTFSVFAADGEYINQFRVRRGVSDLAIKGTTMAVSHASTRPDDPTISMLALDGELLEAFGEPLLKQVTESSELAAFNRFAVAVGDRRIAQVFRHWPLLRLHSEPRGEVTDTWLNFEWWELPKEADWLARPKELLDAPGLRLTDDEVRPVVFWDVAYGRESKRWYGLLAVGIVQWA